MSGGAWKTEAGGGSDGTNRFARFVQQLGTRERRVAQAALTAAEATFADFRDHRDSHYYQALGMTPQQTWKAITAEVGRVTAIAGMEAIGGGSLTAEDFEAIHTAIFRPLFGEQTLRLRQWEDGPGDR